MKCTKYGEMNNYTFFLTQQQRSNIYLPQSPAMMSPGQFCSNPVGGFLIRNRNGEDWKTKKKMQNCLWSLVKKMQTCGIVQVGGRESHGYTKLDQKNYLRSKRQNKLANGEAGCLLKYFSDKTLKNPSFFYVVQLDSEEQITNIFWIDTRMIMDYGHFGAIVSFDTTYKTNKENRPFGVFLGFNHHRETVVFRVALMYDETVDSYIWLFETFL
ncbi:hypothetical protein Ddye_023554 [Dipteronia dyeriana]|uniref:MULE transposase domain-containing protein n=1 Tax=Dipteronia dyeriana TaxID=168575 RepID=A0AAD9WSR7_9ROSI|nr:hypothetical protein Ddye_023554 [Dipteronia dyeriana]